MKVKFNLYEKLFLVIGISFVTLVAVNSQASLLATIFSILCILNAVYAAKGLILGYVFEIFSTCIYIYLSLNQRFYSEVITSLFMVYIIGASTKTARAMSLISLELPGRNWLF